MFFLEKKDLSTGACSLVKKTMISQSNIVCLFYQSLVTLILGSSFSLISFSTLYYLILYPVYLANYLHYRPLHFMRSKIISLLIFRIDIKVVSAH